MHVSERNTSIMFCKDCYIVWHIDWQKLTSPLYCGFTYYEDKDGMEEEEAIEWIEFNIIGAWVGAGTPIIVWDFDLDEFKENPDG